ncbi:protein shisa-5 isoform X1 [Ceratitis capitata]|uniref:protein shisa-5 isoform X1 n=1 Tax=Ceratitis capitata TaxID=7213 RepID=UPI0003296A14|nr:protein shisa-5 isoform X1 [Ceratitis capitata]
MDEHETAVLSQALIGAAIVLIWFYCVFEVCRRRRHHNYQQFPDIIAPVVVTSTTHTAPGGYPVTQVPPPAVYQQQPMYPPYPTSAGGPVQMPMPMPMPGMHPPAPGMQPYPPAVPAANYNPPSYDAAVAGVGVAQPNTTSNTYEKQAPYNPNYNNAY